MAYCDTPPVLEPSKPDLDAVAAFVFPPVVFERFSFWNAEFDTLLFQDVSESVGLTRNFVHYLKSQHSYLINTYLLTDTTARSTTTHA